MSTTRLLRPPILELSSAPSFGQSGIGLLKPQLFIPRDKDDVGLRTFKFCLRSFPVKVFSFISGQWKKLFEQFRVVKVIRWQLSFLELYFTNWAHLRTILWCLSTKNYWCILLIYTIVNKITKQFLVSRLFSCLSSHKVASAPSRD